MMEAGGAGNLDDGLGVNSPVIGKHAQYSFTPKDEMTSNGLRATRPCVLDAQRERLWNPDAIEAQLARVEGKRCGVPMRGRITGKIAFG
jgi:hypothetical protein